MRKESETTAAATTNQSIFLPVTFEPQTRGLSLDRRRTPECCCRPTHARRLRDPPFRFRSPRCLFSVETTTRTMTQRRSGLNDQHWAFAVGIRKPEVVQERLRFLARQRERESRNDDNSALSALSEPTRERMTPRQPDVWAGGARLSELLSPSLPLNRWPAGWRFARRSIKLVRATAATARHRFCGASRVRCCYLLLPLALVTGATFAARTRLSDDSGLLAPPSLQRHTVYSGIHRRLLLLQCFTGTSAVSAR